LTTNKYVWIKNGVRVDSSNKNTLILKVVVPCDAGTYTVEVTNSAAPLLTLKSRIIKVVVSGSLPSRSFDTTICAGSSLRLLSGRVVVAAGNYADTLRNIRNCDSFIVNTRLIIAPAATTARLNPIICLGQNYTLPNNQIVSPTVTTTYRDTLKNKIGCDSVIRITTVNVNIPTVLPTQNPTICRGQSYTLPSSRLVSPLVSTVFNDTLRNQNGCDSLIRSTNLTVIQPKERPLSISICSGQKHTLPKNTVVSISGVYRDTFRSSVGCDSIIITTLTVNPPILFERNKTIFDGQKDTLPKGRVVNTEGVYRDSFKTKNGCDSIVVTTLTVKKIVLDDICFEAMKKNITDAFTPNDDGVNDVFDPEKYFILSGCPYSLHAEQLMIVSRWGEVIFNAKPYEAWDGTSQNYKKPVAPGAYYYVLVFKFDGVEKVIRGVINCFSR
jgi:gliding motility-associated-like protein